MFDGRIQNRSATGDESGGYGQVGKGVAGHRDGGGRAMKAP